MSAGPPDPLIVKSGREEGRMGGGDRKADGQASEAAAGEEGRAETAERPVPEGQAPPAGTKGHADTEAGDELQKLGGEPGEPPGDWLEPLEDDEVEDEDKGSVDLDVPPQVNGRREAETERLIGWAGRIGSGERKHIKRDNGDDLGLNRRKLRKAVFGEKWVDWPLLAKGWKRREVFRRSGFSMGKTDTYYMSPKGERVRSKIELVKLVAGAVDLSNFDYKTGVFLEEASARVKRKRLRTENAASTEDGTPSERSFSSEKTGTPERTHTPQSQSQSRVATPQRPVLSPAQATTTASPHFPNSFCSPPRLVRASPLDVTPTGNPGDTNTTSHLFGEFSPQRLSAGSTPSRDVPLPQLSPGWLSSSLAPLSPTSSPERDCDAALEGRGAMKSSPCLQPAGHIGYAGTSGPLVYGCSICGNSYPGMVFRRPDQKSYCPKCKSEKKDSPRNIVFRKWLPCGQCRACQVTQDCGTCASCRHALFNPASLKPVRCRRRKCLCPIRKVGQGQWVLGRSSQEKEAASSPSKSTNKISKYGRKLKLSKLKKQIASDVMRSPRALQKEYAETKRFKKQYAVPQYSDNEDFPGYYDDIDDMESGPKKRNRRACWKCDACLRTTDCGRCDFCMDKPKFGGRNKKRQKCRLRQCQSHAMRHLLPFQVGGKPRKRERSPRYRYSNRRMEPSWDDMELTNDEDEEGYIGTLRPGVYEFEHDEEDDDDRSEADHDTSVELQQMNSFLHYNPNNGALSSDELYISNYPLHMQDGYQTDSGGLKISNLLQLPANNNLDASQPLPSPQDPEVLYNQASLPAESQNVPETFRKTGKEATRLALGDDVEVVQVDTAEESEEPEFTPVITQIFSLASGSPAVSEEERELLGLLEALRLTVLPPHWVGLMVEGPRLQLLQCSKLSTMADTVLQIEPGFFYRISVQDQPLLLTHPLYEAHPPRLDAAEQVVAALLDLEQYTVCQGYPACVPRPEHDPVLYVRAAACQLLVPQTEERCDKCDVTQLVL
ncbi:hypothetical protein AGOR_G00139280 [Albula goreensis]|uniref:Methyl-CpG-binding domain protein 1 n=1 Tax=Albula goreensis TaxID=1534307 RepID=A0A8T3D5V0_9TELE|nr:hypothetical protein AGOR_G00139280 [Albula goreensis]